MSHLLSFPVAFLLFNFFGHPCKEDNEVLVVVHHVSCIAAVLDGSNLYTDHYNLIHFFDLLSIVPDLSQTSFRNM